MRFEHEFYKLPYRFDVEKLWEEVGAFKEIDWTDRGEQAYKGNTAIQLVSTEGEINETFAGPMKTTKALDMCPYLTQVIATFGQVIGRSRLMRIAPGEVIPPHRDANYQWYKRGRLHIPIVTSEKVRFLCNDIEVNMAAGEPWMFDSWKEHTVINNSDSHRIHLVLDFSPSGNFWDMLDRSFRPGQDGQPGDEPEFVEFEEYAYPTVLTEKYCLPVVLSAGEMDGILNDICQQVRDNKDNPEENILKLERTVRVFCGNWRAQWLMYGTDQAGWDGYRNLIKRTKRELIELQLKLILPNGGNATNIINNVALSKGVNPKAQ